MIHYTEVIRAMLFAESIGKTEYTLEELKAIFEEMDNIKVEKIQQLN